MQTTINLLPPELRPKKRPPLKTLLPYAATAAIVLVSATAFGYLHFVRLAEAEAQRDALASRLAEKKPKEAYARKLQAEEGDYEARAKTIADIAASRTLWTRKLEQLCDVVQEDEGGNRYLVWLQSFQVDPPKAARGRGRNKTKEGETVNADGVCFADQDLLEKYNRFHEDLKKSSFYMGDFLRISNPAGSALAFDDGQVPTRAWTVDLEMVMKSPEDKAKSTKRPVRAN